MAFATSKSNNFVFIHINKTAGTSIFSILERYADPREYGVEIYPGPHAYACQAKNYLGEEIYNSYFSFAFVRNPWARMLSLYSFLQRRYKKSPTFKNWHTSVGGTPLEVDFNYWLCNCEYFDERADTDVCRTPFQKRDQFTWLTDYNDNKRIVDFVGKVENIESDWKHICQRTGIKYSTLPKRRRSEHAKYQDVYTQQSIDFVATHFKRDIETFGYDY